jgi:hypothetical protein
MSTCYQSCQARWLARVLVRGEPIRSGVRPRFHLAVKFQAPYARNSGDRVSVSRLGLLLLGDFARYLTKERMKLTPNRHSSWTLIH